MSHHAETLGQQTTAKLHNLRYAAIYAATWHGKTHVLSSPAEPRHTWRAWASSPRAWAVPNPHAHLPVHDCDDARGGRLEHGVPARRRGEVDAEEGLRSTQCAQRRGCS